MPRVIGAVASHRRRKKTLDQAKGFTSARRTQLRKAKETLMRAKRYRTIDRKLVKRNYRNLWIIRLNAAARSRGLKYSTLIHSLRKGNVQINRQQLSELAINDPQAFDAVLAAVSAN